MNRENHIGLLTPIALAMSVALAPSFSSFAAEQEKEDKGLEIIEVTAQKRTESIQSVPIAITAFGNAEMNKMGAININDLGMLTPGLETNNATATQTSFNIRGISTNDFGIGLDAAVAVYIDGVYVGRRGTTNLNFNDVERVEILKGPQGTLFGRNSAAGAIHIISKDPTADNEGNIQFTLGSHDKRKVELAGNFIIAPDMNFRGSFNSNHRGGYLDIANSDDKYGNQRDWSARGALDWELSPDSNLMLRVDFSDTNQQARPAVSLNTGYFASGDPFSPIEFDFEGKETREAAGFSAEYNKYMGDMTFTSITAYRQFERTNAMEDDGSAFARAYFVSNLIEDQYQISQEFRITQNTDDFKWTLGATLFHENIEQETQATFNTLTFDALAVVQLGGDPRTVAMLPEGTGVAGAYMTMGPVEAQQAVAAEIGRLMGEGYTFEQAQGLVGQQLIYANLDKVYGKHQESFLNEGKTNSAALYFDGTYSITESFDITLGARYTYDEKDFYLSSSPQNFFDVPFGDVGTVPLTVAFIPQTADQSSDWSKFTPRIVFDYQITDDVMTYLSYSEGFKAGGFNTLGESDPVKEETVKNSEFGLKSTWFDNKLRLNLSAYQYDYTNLQQLELVGPSGSVPTYNLRNVDAKGNGYDVEMVWQATPDLVITANYGNTNTEYTKWQFFSFEDSSTAENKVGQPISGMPEDQGNIRADYYFEALAGQMNMHLSYAYTGDRTQGVDGPKLAILPFEQGSVTGLNDDELNSISAYGLLNARISWESNDHPINLALYVHNATDEQYLMQTGGQAMAVGSPIATPGLPRMLGIEFGMNF
jgi:iron complex outermembrane receptor protein